MKITVLGTGMVGQALAGKLLALGHDVAVGTRDAAKTLASRDPNAMGQPGFAVWYDSHPKIKVLPYADAAAHGVLVVNCTNGAATLDVLKAAGAANLAGKVLLDVANPLDFSRGMPPSLFVCNTDSLGEQVQRAFPEARVVKSLNTMNCQIMADPSRVPGRHSVFASGNDQAAKQEVKALLASFGWQDIIDLGDITTARGTEQLLPVWIRLWAALGTADFNFAIQRG